MSQAKETWKAAHWRILEYGPRDEHDWQIAKDLIDQGYADSSYRADDRGNDKVLNLHWRGVTPAGQWYAKWLRQEIEQVESPGHIAKEILWIIGVAVVFLIAKCIG